MRVTQPLVCKSGTLICSHHRVTVRALGIPAVSFRYSVAPPGVLCLCSYWDPSGCSEVSSALCKAEEKLLVLLAASRVRGGTLELQPRLAWCWGKF